jgi:DNA-binding transcriptional MerR regulator
VPGFRSAAVARIARIPVATLRIWEQRYQAVRPATAPSGHRLYSPADVQRVLLLRRLTEAGHAIGSIAALDAAQLQQVAQAAEGTPAPARRGAGASARLARALRLAVVGPALALRLQQPAPGRVFAPARVVAVFDALAGAARAATAPRADVLLWHAPELRPTVPPGLEAARAACGARRVAVVYRFASAAATQALAAAGVALLREPADDAALAAWLASMAPAAPREPMRAPAAPRASGAPAPALPPRRFDDTALVAIAGLAPTLACECPRHVAELLMQLASFETYSAGCIARGGDDAALHAYLHQVAGASRALFESALERVAHHEGLALA